jgi:hypothetical protein
MSGKHKRHRHADKAKCLKSWLSNQQGVDQGARPKNYSTNNPEHFVQSALLKELAGTQKVELENALFLSSKCLVIKETSFFWYCLI